MDRFEHQLAGRRRILRSNLHLPDALAPFAALDAQLLERAHPALVARAPRLHALANPNLFLGQLLVEQRRMLGLDFERRSLLQNVIVIVARPDSQLSPIEFHDPRRQRRTKARSWLMNSSAPSKSSIMSSSQVMASISR